MTVMPHISIIIVNWNGEKWLKKCLDSLLAQTYKNFEIIFVDNASEDGSVKLVKTNYPDVIVVESDENLGFAGGNNLGFMHAKGEYILLLNNDTWAEEDYLEKFIEAFHRIPNLGCAQSKIVLMNNPEKLDVCGSFWTDSSFLYHYGYGQNKNDPRFNKILPFFSNKGAAMLIRRSVLEEVGFFDQDFWCYYEETDLCHRIWIAGYECWYYPSAAVYHAMGGTLGMLDNSYLQYHNFKNKLLSFTKNFEISSLLRVLPIFLLLNGGLSLLWLIQGKWQHFFSFYKALYWNVTHINGTLKKRGEVQFLRKKSDREIAKRTKRNPSLRYYYYLFSGLEKYDG
jgi:GT2 family glycosyltransferase